MTQQISNLNQLEHLELRSTKTGEVYSQSAVLTDLIGFKDLFVHHEIIAPGHKTSAPHAHSDREEMVLVLEGEVVAHREGQVTALRAGDFAGFRPGEMHWIENVGDAVAKALVIASNPDGDRVLSQESRNSDHSSSRTNTSF